MSDVQHLPTFFVRQRIGVSTNRYEVLAAAPDGKPGELLALAEQEQTAYVAGASFFADEQRTQPVLAFSAREPGLLEAGFDVTDGAGEALGTFHREYSTSFLRNVYEFESAGVTGVGMEHSNTVALARRFTDVPFLPVHYTYASSEDEPLLSIERKRRVRDLYLVTVADPRIDYRFATALAVALDAFLNR